MQTLFDARPPTQFLFESFDDFVRVGIPACVDSLPPIVVGGHRVTLRNVRVHPPAHAEADGELTDLTPAQAHARELTYHALLRCDLYDHETLIAGNELLGNLPTMVGSAYDVARGRKSPADHGGYFIAKGMCRCFIGQEIQRPNAPIYLHDKRGWHCDVSSDNTSSRLSIYVSVKGAVHVIMHSSMVRCPGTQPNAAPQSKALSLAHFVRALGSSRPLHKLLLRPGDDQQFVEAIRATLEDKGGFVPPRRPDANPAR